MRQEFKHKLKTRPLENKDCICRGRDEISIDNFCRVLFISLYSINLSLSTLSRSKLKFSYFEIENKCCNYLNGSLHA